MDQKERPQEPTDRLLVLLIRQGDDRAFRLLTERYKPLVASVLHRKLSDHRDIDDEIQETFLRACRRIHTLDDPTRFSGWIARIAVNRAHTRVRQLGTQRETPSGIREMLDRVGNREVRAWPYGLPWLPGREALRSAVATLPADCRAPVLLWATEGCSPVEVGQRLGISAKVASRRIRRGCRHIRAGAAA
jgi:RNA polymerase sigma-70 factor (ECF subfamily)